MYGQLPKYISYWYIQDAIKKATRDCMYYGPNHPNCKASWKEAECLEAYFNDRFKKIPQLTRKDADLCKDPHGKDNNSRGGIQ